MNLDLHLLDLRYQALRKRDPRSEHQLLASLADIGQQLPIIVVESAACQFIVMDGYKRVRALRRLARDQVQATCWPLGELEALLMVHLLRTNPPDVLEQSWLLCELKDRFALSLDELGRRLDRSKSWISRRLALSSELPMEIQNLVRSGQIAAHAAMKSLVPLARANPEAALTLARAIAPLGCTTRQVELLQQGWQSGNNKTRALIVSSPAVYLRALAEKTQAEAPAPVQSLQQDLRALCGIAVRARQRLMQGLPGPLLPADRAELGRRLLQTQSATTALYHRLAEALSEAMEVGDAR